MSQKYHIKPDGTVGVCKAEKGGCPYQTAPHFNSKQEAQSYSEKQSEKKHGLLPEVKTEANKQPQADQKLHELGYEKECDNKFFVAYKLTSEDPLDYVFSKPASIVINKDIGYYTASYKNNTAKAIPVEEHLVIHEKLKELGIIKEADVKPYDPDGLLYDLSYTKQYDDYDFEGKTWFQYEEELEDDEQVYPTPKYISISEETGVSYVAYKSCYAYNDYEEQLPLDSKPAKIFVEEHLAIHEKLKHLGFIKTS